MGYLLVSYWPIASQRPHKLENIPSSGYPPELDSTFLLLKISHTSITEHGDFKLVPNFKLHPRWLKFMILECALQAVRGEM